MARYQSPGYSPTPGPGYRGLLEDRFRKMLTGQLKLWELPEFQAMEHTLGRRGTLAREGAGRQMRSMGLRGPAVATTLGKMEESQMAPLGEAMRSTYGRMPGMAMDWQRHLDALAEAGKMRELQRYLGEEGLGLRGDIAQQQFMLGLLRSFL